MKKFSLVKSSLVVALLALTTVGIQSCKKDSDPDRDKFFGSYTSTSPCVATASWTTAISTSSTGDENIVISNLGGSGLTVTATVSGDGFVIASQTATDTDGDTWTISGSGTISGTSITAPIIYTFGTSTFTCSESWVKK